MTTPLVSSSYTFTLTFKHGEIAVLEVRGAVNQDEARVLACTALPGCSYEVTDSDQSAGRAFCFYTWSDAHAQECQPVQGRSDGLARSE